MSVQGRPFPTGQVVNADGFVVFWAPSEDGAPWSAGVWRQGATSLVEARWVPGTDEYTCATCGTFTDRLGCEHVRAATGAATIWLYYKTENQDDGDDTHRIEVGDLDAELARLLDDRARGDGGDDDGS